MPGQSLGLDYLKRRLRLFRIPALGIIGAPVELGANMAALPACSQYQRTAAKRAGVSLIEFIVDGLYVLLLNLGIGAFQWKQPVVQLFDLLVAQHLRTVSYGFQIIRNAIMIANENVMRFYGNVHQSARIPESDQRECLYFLTKVGFQTFYVRSVLQHRIIETKELSRN